MVGAKIIGVDGSWEKEMSRVERGKVGCSAGVQCSTLLRGRCPIDAESLALVQ